MGLLVTGGHGFVMSNFIRLWLQRHSEETTILVDAAAEDEHLARFLDPVRHRISRVLADVTSIRWSEAPIDLDSIRYVVHAATITPHPFVDDQGVKRQPETEDPARVLEVNMMGTVRILEWVRTLPNLQRLLYVSSGSVYNEQPSELDESPAREDGDVSPSTLYGISKYSCELICRRYRNLFELPVVIARPSGVFGPLDRQTSSRGFRSIPNVIAHCAVRGKAVRVNALEGVCDIIHVEDVADAFERLLTAPTLEHDTYNVSAGYATSIGEMISFAKEKCSDFGFETAPEEEAEIVRDPTKRGGYWGAYDSSRLQTELGWHPRSSRDALRDYLEWLLEGNQA